MNVKLTKQSEDYFSLSLRGAQRRGNPASARNASGLLRYARNDDIFSVLTLVD